MLLREVLLLWKGTEVHRVVWILIEWIFSSQEYHLGSFGLTKSWNYFWSSMCSQNLLGVRTSHIHFYNLLTSPWLNLHWIFKKKKNLITEHLRSNSLHTGGLDIFQKLLLLSLYLRLLKMTSIDGLFWDWCICVNFNLA